MGASKSEVRKVIAKLDEVQLELMRLRAQLLPGERPSPTETRRIVKGRKEIQRGHSINLPRLRRELRV